mmetsp:Transcript_40064/g.86734  ORF Transcript_40064/g.86734 Transcript_40064/m.86734 type:complete len:92 (-) Transcript_40064:257-532(-)
MQWRSSSSGTVKDAHRRTTCPGIMLSTLHMEVMQTVRGQKALKDLHKIRMTQWPLHRAVPSPTPTCCCLPCLAPQIHELCCGVGQERANRQ